MGLAIIHHSPLWAQADNKIMDLFLYKFSLDSVWDLALYGRDRVRFVDNKKLSQFSTEVIFASPMMNPCFFSGGTFEGFTTQLSLLILGYPYYFARNKEKTETKEQEHSADSDWIYQDYQQRKVDDEIEVVQMWTWLDVGQACCKKKVSSDDDWFSALSSSLVTPYSFSLSSLYMIDIESLMETGEPYFPQIKYPLGTWDQIDTSQLIYWSLSAAGGCSGGLFGGSSDWLFSGNEYEYEKRGCMRLRWQWDFSNIETEDFIKQSKAEEVYNELHKE